MKNIILITILASLLCACSTVNTVERADPQGHKQMVSDKRIITDSSLDDYAYIAGINESIVSDNLLKIQIEIVNSSTAYRSVNYQFSWFDENGMEVSGITSPWQTLNLEGGERKYISAVATNPKAKDFTLKLLPNVR